MNQNPSVPGRGQAVVVVIIGGLLLAGGLAAGIGYLGLPILVFGPNLLGAQLGTMAGIFLGLGFGSILLFHGAGVLLRWRSRPLRLPPFWFFGLIFAIVLGLGNLLLNNDAATGYVFPVVFWLGAALPTLAVLAWAERRLGWPITWRQAALALACGGTLSILVAIVAETVLPILAYALIGPLQFLSSILGDLLSSGGGDFIGRLFLSPLVVVFLITTALEAPIPEEFAKNLALPLFGRGRITSERQAFALGLASGAGFAILENMLYEGLYAQYNGWSWGGITLLRGLGSVLHPICAGFVAIGWFRMRERGLGAWLKTYGLAVGLHTLWNGGFAVFLFFSGLDVYGRGLATWSLYGLPTEALLVAFLVALALGLWWLLGRVTAGLAQNEEPDVTPAYVSTRALASWALASALVVVPVGAVLGSAWPRIAALILGVR
jgi:hypothetical protein